MSDGNVVTCTDCDSVFASLKAMRGHRSRLHVPADATCRVCDDGADVIRHINGTSYCVCADCAYRASFDWKGIDWESHIEQGREPDELADIEE